MATGAEPTAGVSELVPNSSHVSVEESKAWTFVEWLSIPCVPGKTKNKREIEYRRKKIPAPGLEPGSAG